MKLKYIFLIPLFLICQLVSAKSEVPDPTNLQLASIHALIVDMETGKPLYEKNTDRVVPIASITKLMAAIVALDSKQPLEEKITFEIQDTELVQEEFSRVRLQSKLTRKEVLLLALMSSENRAAATLAHHYTGGVNAFVKAMNTKDQTLGMKNSHFVEPSGLSEQNVSSAQDLIKLIKAAGEYPLISELTTTPKDDMFFTHPRYALAFYNTNPLVNRKRWDIELTKTGFTNEAGRCLVMRTNINGKDIGLVLLDSYGKRTHIGDAGRIRRWLETGSGGKVPASALSYAQNKLAQL
jgi:D-alanyl-D-alanine endopeptidase (penicillin-binding protein 7)